MTCLEELHRERTFNYHLRNRVTMLEREAVDLRERMLAIIDDCHKRQPGHDVDARLTCSHVLCEEGRYIQSRDYTPQPVRQRRE